MLTLQSTVPNYGLGQHFLLLPITTMEGYLKVSFGQCRRSRRGMPRGWFRRARLSNRSRRVSTSQISHT